MGAAGFGIFPRTFETDFKFSPSFSRVRLGTWTRYTCLSRSLSRRESVCVLLCLLPFPGLCSGGSARSRFSPGVVRNFCVYVILSLSPSSLSLSLHLERPTESDRPRTTESGTTRGSPKRKLTGFKSSAAAAAAGASGSGVTLRYRRTSVRLGRVIQFPRLPFSPLLTPIPALAFLAHVWFGTISE